MVIVYEPSYVPCPKSMKDVVAAALLGNVMLRDSPPENLGMLSLSYAVTVRRSGVPAIPPDKPSPSIVEPRALHRNPKSQNQT